METKTKQFLFCLSSQCFESDTSQTVIAPVCICGNFVLWAGSFAINQHISARGCLLCMPVELRFVSACATDFVFAVDKKLWEVSELQFFLQHTVLNFWSQRFQLHSWGCLVR